MLPATPTWLLAALAAILVQTALLAPAWAQEAAAVAAPASKLAGRMITLSDFGSEDLAYLAVPNAAPTTGLVLLPDAYGLDDFTKAEADRLASLGYLVEAVDIYNGRQTTDPGDLANLIQNLNAASVMKTLDSAIRLFHESPKYKVDHVIVMGWGTGATYAMQAAREDHTIDGAMTFYGPCPMEEHVGHYAAPLCTVFSDRDPSTPHDAVLTFLHRMKDAGNDCEAWFIAAGSGWSNPKSKTYSPGEDREAWKVALPFVIRIAAEPPRKHESTVLDKAKDKIESLFQ
jgi:carboxymethylenebutenolidase